MVGDIPEASFGLRQVDLSIEAIARAEAFEGLQVVK
jgi:hypothetical protein